jgi:hypothetical protein
MDISSDKQLLLFLATDRKNDLINLFAKNPDLVVDIEEIKQVVFDKFYPEIFSAKNAAHFSLSKNDLVTYFKRHITQHDFVEDFKLVIENGLFPEIINLTDIIDIVCADRYYSQRHLQVVPELFDYLESVHNITFDYKEIFNQIFAKDNNIELFTRCLEKGITVDDLEPETVAAYMKINYRTYLSSSKSHNSLTMLLDHREKFGLKISDLWRQAIRGSVWFYGNIVDKFWDLGEDFVIETAQDISSSMPDCPDSNYGDYHDYIEKLLRKAITSPAFEKGNREDFIYMIGTMNIDKQQKFFSILGFDLVEEISKHCSDPEYETDFDLEFYEQAEELEQILGQPFLYNTQREFDLYLKAQSYKFMLAMIRNGFNPTFDNKNISWDTAKTLFEFAEINDLDLDIFVGVDFSGSRLTKLSDNFEAAVDEIIVSGDNKNVIFLLRKVGGEVIKNNFAAFTRLLTEANLAIQDLEQVQSLMFQYMLKEHIDFCFDVIQDKNANAETILKKSFTEFLTTTIIQVGNRVNWSFNYDKFAAAKQETNFINAQSIIKHIISSKNLELVPIVQNVIKRFDDYTSKTTGFALTIAIFDIDIAAFCDLGPTFKEYAADAMALIFARTTSNAEFKIAEFADVCLKLQSEGKNFITKYVCGTAFFAKHDATEFYDLIKNEIPLDAMILEMLDLPLEELVKSGLLKNRYLGEYVLMSIVN